MSKSKRTITENKGHVSPYTFSASLKSIREEIDCLIKEHGEEARLDWNPNFYYPYDHDPSPRFEIETTREETDEEYAARLLKEQQAKDRRRSQLIEELKRLEK